MKIYKCRKCGAPLLPQEDQITAVCENCNYLFRLPRVDSDLYNAANQLRMEKCFDQAAAMFRECISQDPQDSESHWNLLLCKYGVEYVEDKDGIYIPTCNGIAYDSILEDEDYIDAVRFADEISARLYREEAQRIYVIQQEIIKLSKSGEDFDVFISYKETDEEGARTEDSVLAQEIYDELIRKGYKVFFSRVTLKGQAGLKYEPIIFSALNSAPVMLLVGTSNQNLESVWVKNEWTRFLNLMEEDTDKKIEVVYKHMDRIELPAKLRFVPQRKLTDADKFGWTQDIAYDVDSMLEFKKKVVNQGGFIRESDADVNERTIKNLYLRSEQFLEEGKLEEAKKCLEQATDIDFERTETWWKLLLMYSENLTKFDSKNPEPDDDIQYYADQVLEYAKESEKEWKDATENYLQDCRYVYGKTHYWSLLNALDSKEKYKPDAQEKIKNEYEIVQEYAAPSAKAEAKKFYKAWEEKLPIWEEYQQKTANTNDFFHILLAENGAYRELEAKASKNYQKLQKKIKQPLIFGFSNVLMMVYLYIAPGLITVWEAEGATYGPTAGWTAFGSMVCLVGYAIGLVIAFLMLRGKDSRKFSDIWTRVLFPLLGIILATIFSVVFYKLLLVKAGEHFGVAITVSPLGNIEEEAKVALFTAAQPAMKKFCSFLSLLMTIHIGLAIWTKVQKASVLAADRKNKKFTEELVAKTDDAVDKFHEYYRNELGSGSLKQDSLTKDVRSMIPQRYK